MRNQRFEERERERAYVPTQIAYQRERERGVSETQREIEASAMSNKG